MAENPGYSPKFVLPLFPSNTVGLGIWPPSQGLYFVALAPPILSAIHDYVTSFSPGENKGKCYVCLPGRLKTLSICSFRHFLPQPNWNKFYLKNFSLESIPYGDKGNTPDDNGERRWEEPGFLTVWSTAACLLAPDLYVSKKQKLFLMLLYC